MKKLSDKTVALLIDLLGKKIPAKETGMPLLALWSLEERGVIKLYDPDYSGTESTRVGLTPFGRQIAEWANRGSSKG